MGTFTHERLPDWPTRFAFFLSDSQDIAEDLKLDWDNVTCTSWSGDMIEAITGHNPYDPFMGRHKSIASAARVIKEAGFSSLTELMLSLFDEVPVGKLQAGDLYMPSARWAASCHMSPENTTQCLEVMPHAVAVADPPFFWCVGPTGLEKGELYTTPGIGLAVGRSV